MTYPGTATRHEAAADLQVQDLTSAGVVRKDALLRNLLLVQGAGGMAPFEYGFQALSAEEVPAFRLDGIPHSEEADGTLMSLEERVDELCLVARHYG